MPSCLGLYADKNVIKYAKVSFEKTTGYTLDAYGVKFYDNISTTVGEIADEVGMETGPLALALSGETYYTTQVFSNLKKKDMTDLILNEYIEKFGDNGTAMSVMEMRFKLAKNIGVLDKNLAICVSASKGELANINQTYSEYKIATVQPLSISVKNLFENEGIDEESVVINIEDKTTITIFHRSEIQYVTSIPLGTQEIISSLTEKYNSASKAYEACKKVSAYLDESFEMDDESRDILDVMIPVLYDIRARVEDILTPYAKEIKKIYITGTGAIINNIDLYFHQVFVDVDCEILKPFFLRRDTLNIKDIIEVNSAIALGLDGIGMATTDLEFNTVARKAAGIAIFEDILKKLKIKEYKELIVTKTKETMKKLNTPVKPKRRRKRKKAKVDFDESLISKNQDMDSEDEIPSGAGPLDLWLQRIMILTVSTLVVYTFVSTFVSKNITEASQKTLSEITNTEGSITVAKSDAEFIRGKANEYVEITEKLEVIMEKISAQERKNFNIPNFMSKLMFIMPADVQILSININEMGQVIINAESGQYAELGYFVSRLKLEGILNKVNMEVVSVDSNIKIIVSGVLPWLKKFYTF